MPQPINVQILWAQGLINFPWTKLGRLMRLTEVWGPQLEDDMDGSKCTIEMIQAKGDHVALLMDGPKALGYVAYSFRGRLLAQMHCGFKTGVKGAVKKQGVVFTMSQVFKETSVSKIAIEIPSFNLPARILARNIGFVPEGRNTAAFLRGGMAVDLLLYGMKKDVFPFRQRAEGQQRPDWPSEHPQSAAN